MNRRKFLDGLVKTGTVAALGAGPAAIASPRPLCPPSPAAPPAAGGAPNSHWIIPSDKPDQFHLKVMEFNPIPAPDLATWELEIGGLVEKPLRLKLADLHSLPQITQSSRLKCVQCWSARITWNGFRAKELLKIIRPKPGATWMRVDCADRYYDFHSLEALLYPHTLFATGMYGHPLTPEHGAPLRLVIPFEYGYKSTKLITKITMMNHGGKGVVADTWPYYTQSGRIQPGYDHPFDIPGVTKSIKGGEITEY